MAEVNFATRKPSLCCENDKRTAVFFKDTNAEYKSLAYEENHFTKISVTQRKKKKKREEKQKKL